MSKINYKNLCLYSVLIVAISFCSCEKFLDKKSNDVLVVPTSLRDLQALLDDAVRMNNVITPAYLESAADDYFLQQTTYESQPLISQELYQWKPIKYFNGGDWSKPYVAIYYANLVLERLAHIQRHAAISDSWDNARGSALFYRSYYFLWLAWNFSPAYDKLSAQTDLGIVLKESSDFNTPSIRSNVKDTYEKIILDTKASLQLLPALPLHKYRPSKAAAYGLLARVYWSMRDYNNTLLYADSCLKLQSTLMNLNGDTDINGSLTANVPFKQFNKEIIFYSEMSNSFPSLHITSRARIDTLLYTSFSQNDLRKTAFFRPNSGYQQFKGNYTGNANNFFTGIAVDEMYLLRAETQIRSGNLNEGLADLNKVLTNRHRNGTFTPYSDIGENEGLKLVLKERRKELLMRGLRWIDIKRLNKENANILLHRKVGEQTFQLEPNAKLYALPLPDDIVRLTGMQQNE